MPNSQETFLAQTYSDAWSDYLFSLEKKTFPTWNWIIITAANNRQAESYRIQMNYNEATGCLPKSVKWAIVPDVNGERIGSGGATLNVFKYIIEHDNIDSLLKGKILIIHSGGDSKRIPQYSACGKLFAPVPRKLPNNKRATIFDELLIAVSGVPSRMISGVLVLPGDTDLLFNPLQLDLHDCDAAAFSMKASVAEGTEHGVFVNGKNGNVFSFLHKQSEEILKAEGAVDTYNQVDIDTGCIWMGNNLVRALLALITKNNKIDDYLFSTFVNSKVVLSYYADFLYPLAEKATLSAYYKETPEGIFCEELQKCRTIIWNILHKKCFLKLIRLNPAGYIHFGITQEMFDLFVNNINQYKFLGWQKQVICNLHSNAIGAANNSYIDPLACISSNSYIEDSVIGKQCIIENGSIISCLKLENQHIPSNIVLHCLKLKNGKFVCRIYGREDNPKSSMSGVFLGQSLQSIIHQYALQPQDIWNDAVPSIWNALLYPEADSSREALSLSLLLYHMAKGTATFEEVAVWKKRTRYSLKTSFVQADVAAILGWRRKVENYVRATECIQDILVGKQQKDCIKFLSQDVRLKEQILILKNHAKISPFPLNMRLYLAISELDKMKLNYIDDDFTTEDYETKAYECIKKVIIQDITTRYPFIFKREKLRKKVTIELPVRLNFCGSPTDAAPYCLEHGGTMLDSAMLVKGKKPIKAVARITNEKAITFKSFDLGLEEDYTNIEEIRNCGDPSDPFALHKAVLISSGVISKDFNDINDLYEQYGGGIYLSTSANLPKGSGLGTSSILAAAGIKAVHQLLNQDDSNDSVFAQVFAAEQLMATGGGWQDQAGGVIPGIKLIRSLPGINQKLFINPVVLPKSTVQDLQERLVLIFSGQRRLARNVLREEMNQTIRNDKKSLQILEKLQDICALMKLQLERGNVTRFAHYLTEQFKLVKKLDKGASNTCIEYIFAVCDDLIDGKSICGAGGGGFLMVILKNKITKKEIEKRIKDNFRDCGVEVWDCSLYFGEEDQ
ncbi:MAG: bifunctional fucokinase/L-fucose-1-P-guanylyltransferase [Spirochaetia bacterium]|jgi:fucokinase|nr:bifunctional fucokinase/L-fucose-1-P-guanylyltransferase [Spirochaetia bacterium]